MEKQTGWEYQEIWGISPLSSFSHSNREDSPPLWRKVLAGGCMGVVCGLTLTLMSEGPAYADSQPMRMASELNSSTTQASTSVLSETRQELILQAGLDDSYRHRIPAWTKPERSLRALSVTATAYNNVPAQTDATPNIAAWGDRIEPGMQLIAVSRDLVKMGLTRGTRVRISGLDGEFIVLDKMNKRYKKRIDVYMGKDILAARRFGRKRVTISWSEDAPSGVTTLLASQNTGQETYLD